MLNTIIVDDEEFARSSLYFLLQENCENIHISGIAKSVAEARQLLSNNKIDLIFLDIAMPGENGFDLIPQAQLSKSHVIFTTAYDQYALRAIKANALDYLLKPIDIDELKLAVEKAGKYIALNKKEHNRNESLQNLAVHLSERNEIRKISLPNGQGYSLINIDDIIHIEADSNYSIFHLANKETITVSKVLKEYEEILPEQQFVRIHKSSIVNLNYLKEYNSKNGMEVILKNGEKIAVSRRRASDFAEKIKSYTRFESDK
ncbi:two-component system, LytT family, response regulator [Pedobacter steynii]|uniref:Two-component system, LytT family, response regulator n=1 Tax=Pedobacter steynii TaxID=430522 RepID=A0A1G9R496_9SPHI|nr:LytTR family DNA-binding domain-containing protein [Pedobacter steynii]NQX37908.1 response regulator transcription factor [Pedobacter steynii]SDM17245.1 two-component system, LytT family, response regulator [Pedobacter steynii]